MQRQDTEREALRQVQQSIATATLRPQVTVGEPMLEGSYPDTVVRIPLMFRDRGRSDIVRPIWSRGPDGAVYESGDLIPDIDLMLLEAQ